MNSLPKKIAIYLRVSSKKQKDNTSKDTQLQIIQQYIKSHGWENVPYEIYDDTKSASLSPKIDLLNESNPELDDFNPNILLREDLRRLIFDATSKKFDKLLVYSHDRLTRDIYEGLLIRYTLKKLGIEIIYCRAGEQIDSGNVTINNFFENLLSNLAALESNIIGGRVFLGNEYNIRNNIWAGGPPPYGYKLAPNPLNRKQSKLAINPPEARIAKKIFELYNLGYSPKNIVNYIKTKYKYNNDRLWTINSIKSILNNPVYTGALIWNKKGGVRNPKKRSTNHHIKSSVNADNIIISEDVWNKALSIKELQRNNPKFLSTTFLFQGIIICGKCGKNLTCKNHGNSSGRVYFCCDKNHNKTSTSTGHIIIKANEIHNIVISQLDKIIKSILTDTKSFNKFYAEYLDKLTCRKTQLILEKKDLEENILDAENMLLKCTNEIFRLTNQSKVDSTDNENYQKYLSLLNSLTEFEIDLKLVKLDLYENLELLNKKITNELPSKEDLKKILTSKASLFKDILKETDEETKNRCLRLFIHNLIYSIKIDDDKSIEIIFK